MNKKNIEEFMTETEYNQFLEETYQKTERYCDKYGLKCSLVYDQIHIYTVYEDFYFIPDSSGMVRLMHRSGMLGDKYHQQFYKKMSVYEVVRYVMNHTRFRYEKKAGKKK